jgi:serine/threonine protein kinase
MASSSTFPTCDFIISTNQTYLPPISRICLNCHDIHHEMLLKIWNNDQNLALNLIKYNDIKTDYSISEETFGKNGYAEVYIAKKKKNDCDDDDSQEFVVKSFVMEKQDLKCQYSEITIHPFLKHPFIVNLHDVYINEVNNYCLVYHNVFLVLEKMDFDLKQFSNHTNIQINKTMIRNFLHQMLSALQYCHSRGVIHGDVKPKNILVSKDFQTSKLADFGSAILKQDMVRDCQCVVNFAHRKHTLQYAAPEILLPHSKKSLSPAIDIWSLGCVFAELVSDENDALFRASGSSRLLQLDTMFRILGTPIESDSVQYFPLSENKQPTWKDRPKSSLWTSLPHCEFNQQDFHRKLSYSLDSNAIDLLHRMLVFDPCARITADDALKHPYFDEYDSKNNNIDMIQIE